MYVGVTLKNGEYVKQWVGHVQCPLANLLSHVSFLLAIPVTSIASVMVQ